MPTSIGFVAVTSTNVRLRSTAVPSVTVRLDAPAAKAGPVITACLHVDRGRVGELDDLPVDHAAVPSAPTYSHQKLRFVVLVSSATMLLSVSQLEVESTFSFHVTKARESDDTAAIVTL